MVARIPTSRDFPLPLAPILEAFCIAVSSAGRRRETTALLYRKGGWVPGIYLLRAEHAAAAPQEDLCVLPAVEAHPAQSLVTFTGNLRVIFCHLKTWCVFQFIGHDSNYFSKFKILSLGGIVRITLWAVSWILVLIWKTTLALSCVL